MKRYTQDFQLKYKFSGVETIIENYSETFQDMFVLTMLNGKRNGTFLELGAQDPIKISNTYLLESMFGWKGISIDADTSFTELHKKERINTFIGEDALKVDYASILSDYPKQIDYLQVDIDPCIQSYNCLTILPLDTYRFSVITFEHDAYRGGNGLYVRIAARTIFRQHGYILVVGDICNMTHEDSYEDWWVDPRAVDPKLIETFQRGENANIPGDELLST